MSDPLSIGASGLRAAGTQLDVTANNIANVESNGFQASDVSFADVLGSQPAGSNTNIGDEFVKMMIAQDAFAANAKSIESGNQDLGTIINLPDLT
jgi:flagellar hook protein FlgE